MRAANAHIDERYELGALGSAQAWFYEPLGWVRWRGPLAVRTDEGEVRTPEEEGYVWIRFTARTPPLDLERTLTCDPRPGDVW
jgi:aminoglycoside 2'-N-acetyltransferase I